MPCPFDPPENLDIEGKKNPFTVLYVGQFRPFKGIDVLVKAAMVLKDVNFVLVGDGYLKPKLMRISEGLANVKFFGRVSDGELIELYKRAHVVCLPSVNTTEAYGLVLIEGALYGCVPLATNLIGVRENISQLRGLLFEPKSHASLVEKIRMLAGDRALWVNLAERSHKAAVDYVNTYTPDYYVDRHEEIFKGCL
jgi:rhamnosyl/mannosyltransferase